MAVLVIEHHHDDFSKIRRSSNALGYHQDRMTDDACAPET